MSLPDQHLPLWVCVCERGKYTQEWWGVKAVCLLCDQIKPPEAVKLRLDNSYIECLIPSDCNPGLPSSVKRNGGYFLFLFLPFRGSQTWWMVAANGNTNRFPWQVSRLDTWCWQMETFWCWMTLAAYRGCHSFMGTTCAANRQRCL